MMKLKEKLEREYNQRFKHSLENKTREEGFEKFLQKGFPTTSLEEWKYTNLENWFEQDYQLTPEEISVKSEIQKAIDKLPIDSSKLIFVNGIFNSDMSVIQEGLEFSVYGKSDKLPNKMGEILKQEESLVNLNIAISENGYIIKTEDKSVKLKPIEVLSFYKSEKPLFINQRNFIDITKNQEVSIIERYISLDENKHFVNQLTEIDLEENAKLDAYKIQNEVNNTALVDFVFCNQLRDSVASLHTFSMGGELTRNGLNFSQLGQNCNTILQAVTLGDDKQHIDHHTLIEHKAPNCESHELYRTILDGEAVAIFNGKIIVDSKAQKIDAFQQNNNILLSPKSAVDSKPQLEIFADDVKCSHGCTIGQLDKKALFYMKSRGIPEKEAKAYLLYAFCADVINEIKFDPLKNKIAAIIAKKLNVDMIFE